MMVSLRQQFIQLVLGLALALVVSGSALAAANYRQPTLTFYPPPSIFYFLPSTLHPPSSPLHPLTVPPPPDGLALYRMHCSGCHGYQGQGLTPEWRAEWPKDKQNCWQSKCHAANHPPDGFTFPKQVPAVIGPETLAKFATGQDLYVYIRATMPYWAPHLLADDQYQAITAYLIEANYQQRDWPLPQPWPDNNLSVISLRSAPSPTQPVAAPLASPPPRSNFQSPTVLSYAGLGIAALIVGAILATRHFLSKGSA